MSSKQRGALYWVSAWWPVVVAVLVIAIESTEWLGADHTSEPLRRLVEAIVGRLDNNVWGEVHHYIRKCGHFIGYGLMGLAWLRAWWMSLPKSHFLPDSLLAILGTALVASADEYHQSFLSNRTSSPWDVVLDCTGCIVLQLLVYIVMRTIKPKRLARAA